MKKLLTYTLITTMISCFSYVNPSFADTQLKNENIIRLDKIDTQYVFNFQDSVNLAQTEYIDTNTNNNAGWMINFLIPGMNQIQNGYDHGYTFLLIALGSFLGFFGLLKAPILNSNPFGLLPLIIFLLSPLVFAINYIASIVDAIYLKDKKPIRKQ